MIRKLLEVICDEGGFLVEDKLKKLLVPLQNGEKSLIKMDAIFKVAVQKSCLTSIMFLVNFFTKTVE